MKLKIRKWDASTLQPSSIVLILGKRGTGKSYLMRDLCYRMAQSRQYSYGLAMSPTEDVQESFSSFMPESLVYNDYVEEKVTALMKTQRKMWKAGKGKNAYLLLDDCLYNKAILNSTVVKELFFNGRHRRILLMLIAQYAMQVSAELRSQVDYIFVLRENVLANRERIWKNFFGFFNNFSSFCETMDACTENYSALVYDGKASKTNSLEECVFWYRAERQPTFRLCDPGYWSLDRKFYVDREEEFEEMKKREELLAKKKAMQKQNILGVTMVDEDGQEIR